MENGFKEFWSNFHPKDLLQGRIISHDVLMRQWKKIAVIMVLLLVYISNRYTCQQKISELNRLRQELTDVRYEALTISAELMGKSRQSQVKKLMEEKGLSLEESKQPPFKLKR